MNLRKISITLLILYAFSLTVVTVLALTVGPFKESVPLWVRLRSFEAELHESQRRQKSLEEERGRLLGAVKSLQADWNTGQETIRALRELVKNPESEQRLVESNRLAEKLGQERSVLIAKLNELRQELAKAEAELKKVKNE